MNPIFYLVAFVLILGGLATMVYNRITVKTNSESNDHMKSDYKEIKHNEVRVNNILFVTGDGVQDPELETIQIKELQGGDDFRFYIKDTSDYLIGSDFLAPVILTKEWLKKLGFNENFEGDRSDWMIGQFPDVSPFSLQQDSDGIWFYCIGKYLSIEYVHQLQNLYFAITGEELKTETNNCKLSQQ